MGSPLDVVATQDQRTLFDALVDARDRHGGRTRIIEDQERRPLSYTDLIRAAFALGRRLGRITSAREHVGGVGEGFIEVRKGQFINMERQHVRSING